MTDNPRWMVCLGSWGMHSNAATEDEAVHEALECLLDGERAWLEPPNLKSLRAEVRSGLYRRVHDSEEQSKTMNETGFVKIPTAFILASAGRLSSNAFRVVVAIKMHARKDRDPYPSVQTIAKEVGLSKRTVERAIAELRENGLKARGRGRWTSNAYQVDEFMEELADRRTDD